MAIEDGVRGASGNRDRAGTEYWNRSERNQQIVLQRFKPAPGIRGYAKRAWHAAFLRAFTGLPSQQRKLLELGCGGSAFLPYFAIELGFQVFGIDYSENGCDLARSMCAAHGVRADVVCVDFFKAPTDAFAGAFDAVVSFGVVEHFTDTNDTVKKFATFLRPGGILVTIVPNMKWSVGMLQKHLAPEVYDAHEIIDPSRLRASHEAAGLQVLENDYFLFMNYGVINLGNAATLPRRVLFAALRAITGAVWAIETVVGSLRPNAVTSPYVLCVARRLG